METVLLKSHNAATRVGLRAKAPVFVVGSPRSGTTLLYHMLLSAGNFAVYRSETHIFNVFAPHFGDLSVYRNRQRMTDQWLKSKYFRLTGLDPDRIRAELMARCRNAGDFLRIVMESVAKAQQVERWADNTPEHILYMEDIKRSIPEALFIHMIRDGRDVALSLEKKDWVRPFPWERHKSLLISAIYWEWLVDAGRKTGRKLGSDYMEVRFEDLNSNPQEILTAVGHFIDRDIDYDRVRRVAIGTVSKPETSFAEEGQFSPVGRWKTKLTRSQRGEMESSVGDCLHSLGYELEGPVLSLWRSFMLRAVRWRYRKYFWSRMWVKNHVPLARHLTDVSWLRT